MAKAPADLAIMREFGELMSAARLAQKWTQEELAERAGVDPSTVGKIEQGKGNPELLTINKLAAALEEHFTGFFPCRARP